MSTRCLIGKENTDKTITYIYCHHDGYPGYVGKMLLDNYTNIETIDELLALGDMSSLGEKPIAADSFDYFKNEFCVPYALRGEYVPASVAVSEKDFLKVDAWEEFWYLFKDNKWYIASFSHPNFVELTEEDCK